MQPCLAQRTSTWSFDASCPLSPAFRWQYGLLHTCYMKHTAFLVKRWYISFFGHPFSSLFLISFPFFSLQKKFGGWCILYGDVTDDKLTFGASVYCHYVTYVNVLISVIYGGVLAISHTVAVVRNIQGAAQQLSWVYIYVIPAHFYYHQSWFQLA